MTNPNPTKLKGKIEKGLIMIKPKQQQKWEEEFEYEWLVGEFIGKGGVIELPKIKQFISNLLSAQKQELIREIEGMKVRDYIYLVPNKKFQEAYVKLDDVLDILKGKA